MDNINEIKKQQMWALEYIDQLVKAGLTQQEAKLSFEAGKEDFDFNEDARDVARDELGYWID